jgi:hypothetical protein
VVKLTNLLENKSEFEEESLAALIKKLIPVDEPSKTRV